MGGDAFGASDINKGAIAGLMGFFSDSADGFQLLFWIQKTLIAALDVVIHFNAEDVVTGGAGDDRVSVGIAKSPRADADIVCPVGIVGMTISLRDGERCRKQGSDQQDGIAQFQNSNLAPNCMRRGFDPLAVEVIRPKV